MPRAYTLGMKDEMAFLRYRREVVQAWPESPRKEVFLIAIEDRATRIQQAISCATHLAHLTDLGYLVPNRNV
jgi:hypothetical protein